MLLWSDPATHLPRCLVRPCHDCGPTLPRKPVVRPCHRDPATVAATAPCHCKSCRALVKEYGSEAAPLVQGLNRVLAETVKEFPKHEIATFAYYGTSQPPIKDGKKLVPHPNLCFTFVRMGDAMKNMEHKVNRKGLRARFLAWRSQFGSAALVDRRQRISCKACARPAAGAG